MFIKNRTMNDNLFMAQWNWVKENSKLHIKKQIIDQQDLITRFYNYSLHSPKSQIFKKNVPSCNIMLLQKHGNEDVEHDHVESSPPIQNVMWSVTLKLRCYHVYGLI